MCSFQLRVWARPEAVDAGHLDYALDVGARILTYLEDYYNVSYPLPKLGKTTDRLDLTLPDQTDRQTDRQTWPDLA